MTFDASDFLDLAERIVLQETTEAAFRTAISRSYYACHLLGRESTRLKGWFAPRHSGEDHRALLRVLRAHVSWSSQMDLLLKLREHADYHVDARPTTPGSPICQHCAAWNASAAWDDARELPTSSCPSCVK